MDNSLPNQNLEQLKQDLFENLYLRLGGGIVDLEIDPDHAEAAYRYAIKMYRQRSQHSTQESYTMMTLEKNIQEYTLPQEFVNVRTVFRRTFGLESGNNGYGGGSFDPFSSAIMNTYLLNYNFSGGLATYDFYQSYVKLAGRMFGANITYTFNPVTKLLRLDRDFKATGDHILIWGDTTRLEEEILQDPGSGVWLGDFTLAVLKGIIGEAREKFGSIAGPNGGTSLNGAQMKAESKAEIERLIDDLRKYQDGGTPLTWIIG